MIISPKMTGKDEFSNVLFMANLDLLEDNLPEFGIFAMDQFTQAMDLLDEPEINYDPETKLITATDENTSIKYITSEPSSLDYVHVNPEVITSTLKANSVLESKISKDELQKIKKAYSVFKNFDTLQILSEGNTASLSITNLNSFSKNNNAWSMKITADIKKEFSIPLPIDSIMKIPQADYTLQVKYNEERDAFRVVLTNDLITFVLSIIQ